MAKFSSLSKPKVSIRAVQPPRAFVSPIPHFCRNPELSLPLAEAGSHAKLCDRFYSPHSHPSCKFITFQTSYSGSWSENARVTMPSQGFGSDLSPDALSPPTDTRISDCHGGDLAVVRGILKCGGILKLSMRPLVAGQEGPEQPQLPSSQFLPKQSVYFLCGFVCSA